MMDQMASVSFTLDEPSEGSTFEKNRIAEPLKAHLSRLFEQVPFLGTVTGRDNNSIVINLGLSSRLSQGDTIVIGSIDEVRKHPKLKTTVDWRLTRTGKAEIQQIEENMAFCKILEEEPGHEISRFQKVVRIEKPLLVQVPEQAPATLNEPPSDPPRVGWMSASLAPGSSSWQFSSPQSSISNLGGGIAMAANASAEVWLTKEWFFDLSFGYSGWGFSQKDAASGTLTTVSANGGVGASVFSTKLNFGYTYLATGDFFGPKGWLKLGYKTNALSLPSSLTEGTGPTTFGSVFLGIGGDVPIRGKWGVQADFNYRVFSSVSQSWVGGEANSSSDFQLQLGSYYRLTHRVNVLAQLIIQASGAEFSNGASLNQNVITFGPSLMYYF
jgi:hypothetical protein